MSGFKPTRQADDMISPNMGGIRVLAVTTAASAEQDASEFDGNYVSFICDAAFYITFGATGVTDPDETATTGNGRTWRVPADTVFHVRVVGPETFFKVKGAAAGTLRWYKSNG